jgi:hypothetical protein
LPSLLTVYTEGHVSAIALNLLEDNPIAFPQNGEKADAVFSWFSSKL